MCSTAVAKAWYAFVISFHVPFLWFHVLLIPCSDTNVSVAVITAVRQRMRDVVTGAAVPSGVRWCATSPSRTVVFNTLSQTRDHGPAPLLTKLPLSDIRELLQSTLRTLLSGRPLASDAREHMERCFGARSSADLATVEAQLRRAVTEQRRKRPSPDASNPPPKRRILRHIV